MRRLLRAAIPVLLVLAAVPGDVAADSAFQFRLGGTFPRGGGELWQVNEDAFTLDASDFDGFVLGFGLVHSLSNAFEVGLGVDFYDTVVLSAQRGFQDEFGNSVLHDTELGLVPLTVDLRWLPTGRHRQRPGGRRVLKPAFYVGAGLGLNFWEYEEQGDFVFEDADGFFVAFDRFKETGTALETHALAGVEFPLSPRFNLLVEARYSVSDDELDIEDAYNGPGRLEFDSTSVYAGGSIRF